MAAPARMLEGQIVELVHEMTQRGLRIPILVQASPDDQHAQAPEIASAIRRLESAQYAGLSILSDTLSPRAYRDLFGGVVVQPYRAEDFKDRVSGVTLDALSAGCPAVVTAHTWMAEVVQRFDAGVATADLSARGLLAAIETVLADYGRYAANAKTAARELNAQHSARRMLEVVLRGS